MRTILVGLFGEMMDPNVIYCDNKSCMKLYENLVFHDRSKHIDIWYHHLQDCVWRRIVLLQCNLIEEQDDDILIKDLSRGNLEFQMFRIGVVDNTFLSKRECREV